ncbi:MAG: hypothetical protein AAFX55_20210 [Bacteroidota bacterium]
MRILFFIATVLLVLSCKQEDNTKINDKSVNGVKTNIETLKVYEIKKIDSSAPEYYSIYAFKSGKYYKIISDKVVEKNNCKKMKLNEDYELKLDTLYSKRGVLESASSVSVEGKTPIAFEGDSIRVIFSSSNIKGLCYYPN